MSYLEWAVRNKSCVQQDLKYSDSGSHKLKIEFSNFIIMRLWSVSLYGGDHITSNMFQTKTMHPGHETTMIIYENDYSTKVCIINHIYSLILVRHPHQQLNQSNQQCQTKERRIHAAKFPSHNRFKHIILTHEQKKSLYSAHVFLKHTKIKKWNCLFITKSLWTYIAVV
jgi:hypothetical protein